MLENHTNTDPEMLENQTKYKSREQQAIQKQNDFWLIKKPRPKAYKTNTCSWGYKSTRKKAEDD